MIYHKFFKACTLGWQKFFFKIAKNPWVQSMLGGSAVLLPSPSPPTLDIQSWLYTFIAPPPSFPSLSFREASLANNMNTQIMQSALSNRCTWTSLESLIFFSHTDNRKKKLQTQILNLHSKMKIKDIFLTFKFNSKTHWTSFCCMIVKLHYAFLILNVWLRSWIVIFQSPY